MAKQIFSDSPSCVKLNGFGGIDTASPLTSREWLADLVNFRVLSDSSIEKRCGYRKLASLDAPVRAVFSGVHKGKRIFLAIAANILYELDPDSGEILRSTTTVGSEGDADFFFHEGRLYVMDGGEISEYTGSSPMLSTLVAYIPYYGKSWHPTEGGEINEPINMLSDRVRISFDLGEESQYTALNLDQRYKEIVNARIDGVAYSDLELNVLDKTVVSDRFIGAKNVELVLEMYSGANRRERIAACRRAVEFSQDGRARVLLYGGEDSTRVFCSAYVDDEMYSISSAFGGFTGRMYFPLNEGVSVGNGRHPVKAACPLYDRLIIFTEGAAWRAEVLDDLRTRIKTSLVNSSHGASVFGGVALCENTPVTLESTGIFRWSEKSLKQNEYVAEKISSEISSALPEDFCLFGKVCAFPIERELWFVSPGCGESVWIYNYDDKRWMRFDGIGAELIFSLENRIGFSRGNEIFIFDAACRTDACDGGEKAISASLESKYFDFSSPESMKKVNSISLVSEGGGGELSLTLLDERGHGHKYKVALRENEFPKYCEVGVKKERFRYMKFVLEANGEGRERIYSVALRTTNEA